MKLSMLILACVAALVLSSVAFATDGNPGGGHDPVTVCHKPGTPAEQELTFDDDALWAHLNHGDTLGPCVPPAVCPEGTDAVPDSNPLVCIKTVTNTVEVPGPPVYVDVPGPTQYVDVPGPTVTVDVPGPIQYVPTFLTKVKTVTKVKVKVVRSVVFKTKIKVKKVPVIGLCKYQGHLAVPGKG